LAATLTQTRLRRVCRFYGERPVWSKGADDRFWPNVRIGCNSGKRPPDSEQSVERAAVAEQLDFGLFRYLKRVIHLDSKVSNGAFQLAMPQQELNSPQIPRSLIDQRSLSPAHGVGSVNG
jgi:hypothetical protein